MVGEKPSMSLGTLCSSWCLFRLRNLFLMGLFRMGLIQLDNQNSENEKCDK